MSDKLNRVDYHWYLVRTQPGHERELCALIEDGKGDGGNILEAYCPTHTTVNVHRGGSDRRLPLFDGYVFVLATQDALVGFLHDRYPNASLRYNRKQSPEVKATLCTIPEAQMRAFMDFNENYADKVVVLDRPYSDYASNPNEGNSPNEIVRVLDGPLAGLEGYVCRFRRKRGLVFRVQGAEPGSHLAVSYPNIHDLHVVRLHNAECDRLSVGTEKGRAADLLIGILQACGYGGRTLPVFHSIMERLSSNLSLVPLIQELGKQGDAALVRRLSQIPPKDAELLLNLARYEHDNPGHILRAYPKLILRPFLTPTSGIEMEAGNGEAELHHGDFTEIIRKVHITEEVYYPSKQKGGKETTAYYAHIGIISSPHGEGNDGGVTLFANWDSFLGEYFLTAGKANEKLVCGTIQSAGNGGTVNVDGKPIESFRNYAPTLYGILTDDNSPVKAIPGFKTGSGTLNVIATKSTLAGKDTAKDLLIRTCVRICKEINTTTHLAVWRRYLRTVWLHN